MVAGFAILCLIAAGFAALFVALSAIAFLFLLKARSYMKTQERIVTEVETRTKMQYNRIALLQPKELLDYLSTIFSQCIELEAVERITKNDPDGVEKLQVFAKARLLEYLGPDTIRAIDYYYGNGFASDDDNEESRQGYVERWASITYRLLVHRGNISGVIDPETQSPEN